MSDDAPADALSALAFGEAKAADANHAIDRVRLERDAVSYEVVLPRLPSALTERVLPRLVEYLASRGVRLPASGDVFVSLFTEDGRVLFIEAGRFATHLGALRGLDADELMRRYRPGGAGDPPLLGP